MKQAIIRETGGPDVIRLEDADIPEPNDDQVLVKMAFASVSRPDYLIRSGIYPWTKDKLPIKLGIQGSGIVEKTGKNISGIKPGDHVFVMHLIVGECYAEYKLSAPEQITVIPPDISLIDASVMYFFFAAYAIIFDYCADEGKTIYLKGAAGSLGTAMIQIAKLKNHTVIVSASTDEKCEYLRNTKADFVFNYKKADAKEEIMRFTNGRGVDLIFDQIAGENFADQFELLAEKGSVIIYNTLGGHPKGYAVTEKMTEYWPKCINVGVFSIHYYRDKQERFARLKGEVLELVEKGILKPRIEHVLGLSEVVDARRILDSCDFFGSIVLDISH